MEAVPLIDAEEAIARLRAGSLLRGVRVEGPIDLRLLATGDEVLLAVRIEDCALGEVRGESLRFVAGVALVGSSCVRLDFASAYFSGGLVVDRCSVAEGADFQCGAHNMRDRPIELRSTRFGGFVNFFDCWFEGPLVVRECRFDAGTNLLGNADGPARVQFDVSPVLDGNHGRLDGDGG